MDAPGLRRSAAAGGSLMAMTSGASTISMLSSRQSAWDASAASTGAVAPTSAIRASRCRAAATTPSTMAAGA